MGELSPGTAAALVAALIPASCFFSVFEHALKAARKPALLKRADDAERRAQSKRPGSVARLRETRRAENCRRVIKAAEAGDAQFVVTGFWINGLRILAAILAGIGVGHFGVTGNAACITGNAGPVIQVAAVLAGMVFLILTLDHVAKIVARFAPEAISTSLFTPVNLFALPLRPFLSLARKVGRWLRAAFPPKAGGEGMTEDELRHALIEGEKSGIVESKELAMVESVFYLGDRPLGVFMTHRSEVQWLDVNTPPQEMRAKVLEHRNQRCFPVVDGTLDAIIGAADREDIILDLSADPPAGLRATMKKASFAPETMPALKAFESFRRGEADALFVMDEYGGFAGMVSARSLMEKIVGELNPPAEAGEEAVRNDDGSWTANGSLNLDDTASLLNLPGLAGSGDYRTLAGLVLSLAGELPAPGDSFEYRGHRFTVLDMEGNRINKVGIVKV